MKGALECLHRRRQPGAWRGRGDLALALVDVHLKISAPVILHAVRHPTRGLLGTSATCPWGSRGPCRECRRPAVSDHRPAVAPDLGRAHPVGCTRVASSWAHSAQPIPVGRVHRGRVTCQPGVCRPRRHPHFCREDPIEGREVRFEECESVDAQGRLYIHTIINDKGSTAVGQTSGTTYHQVGATKDNDIAIVESLPRVVSFVNVLDLIGHGSAPNLAISEELSRYGQRHGGRHCGTGNAADHLRVANLPRAATTSRWL